MTEIDNHEVYKKHENVTLEAEAQKPVSRITSFMAVTSSVVKLDNVIAIAGFFMVLMLPFHWYAPLIWARLTRYSDFAVFLLSFIVTTLVFWPYALLMGVIDLYEFPKVYKKYRIQPNKKKDVFWYRKAIRQALYNWVFVNFPAGLMLYGFIAYGQDRALTKELLPSFSRLAQEIVVFVIAEEVCFYYTHRLLHHPRIYQHIHKKHHEFKTPIGIAAIYAHPFEHLISKLLPLFVGPLLMQAHIMTVWLWLTMGLITTVNLHCGFVLPHMPTPLDHDYHHQVFNANYGVFGILDAIHGTRGGYDLWRDNWRPSKSLECDTNKRN
ncbi:hypothetical protein BDF19DRAFT_405569 [Syncephalis fuscata]|nr:hypothetical protein BDF19DRAFT_405569 [Syncephalis fuscata]